MRQHWTTLLVTLASSQALVVTLNANETPESIDQSYTQPNQASVPAPSSIEKMKKAEMAPLSSEPTKKAPTAYQAYQVQDFSHLKGMKGFSDELLDIHFKLYEGYVKNANLLYQQFQDMAKNGQERKPEFAGLKRMYGWEFGGMRLHEYYFGNLGGDGKIPEDSQIYKKIVKQFGSYDAWKKDFVATGLIRGIGWAVLYQDPNSGNLINTWINEHHIGHLAGGKPLLVMDVFEHAYITEYGLARDQYIEAFFDNISWNIVDGRYKAVYVPYNSTSPENTASISSWKSK